MTDEEIKECIHYDTGDCMDFGCEGSTCGKRDCARKDMLKDEEMTEYVQSVEQQLLATQKKLEEAEGNAEMFENCAKAWQKLTEDLQNDALEDVAPVGFNK